MSAEPFKSWAVVEIMGHRCHHGLCYEAVVAGVAMLRVDVYEVPDVIKSTHFYPPSSIFSLSPTTQEACLAANQHAPSPRMLCVQYDDDDQDQDDDGIPFDGGQEGGES